MSGLASLLGMGFLCAWWLLHPDVRLLTDIGLVVVVVGGIPPALIIGIWSCMLECDYHHNESWEDFEKRIDEVSAKNWRLALLFNPMGIIIILARGLWRRVHPPEDAPAPIPSL